MALFKVENNSAISLWKQKLSITLARLRQRNRLVFEWRKATSHAKDCDFSDQRRRGQDHNRRQHGSRAGSSWRDGS